LLTNASLSNGVPANGMTRDDSLLNGATSAHNDLGFSCGGIRPSQPGRRQGPRPWYVTTAAREEVTGWEPPGSNLSYAAFVLKACHGMSLRT
jgi:hypothetical protein